MVSYLQAYDRLYQQDRRAYEKAYKSGFQRRRDPNRRKREPAVGAGNAESWNTLLLKSGR